VPNELLPAAGRRDDGHRETDRQSLPRARYEEGPARHDRVAHGSAAKRGRARAILAAVEACPRLCREARHSVAAPGFPPVGPGFEGGRDLELRLLLPALRSQG